MAAATPSRLDEAPQPGHEAIESSHGSPGEICHATSAAHEPPSSTNSVVPPTPHSEPQPTQALAPPQPASSPVATTTAAGVAAAGLSNLQSPPSQLNPSLLPSSTPPTSSGTPSTSTSKMRFSDTYKSPRSTLSKFRRLSASMPAPLAIPKADYDPDLWSKDKAKQKEAIKTHLARKVRNDWEFIWPSPSPPPPPPSPPHHPPPPTLEPVVDQPEAPSDPPPAAPAVDPESVHSAHPTDDELEDHPHPDSDAESVYSTVSEDPVHFRPRLEWTSDLSDDNMPSRSSLSPFRFDTPDAVGSSVKASVTEKRAQRRRALREEMTWNEGLACFEARRNAWTEAKTVRVRPKSSPSPSPSPSSPLSSLSPRRLFRRPSIPTSPTHPVVSLPPQQRRSNDTSTAASDASKDNELTSHHTKDSTQSTTASATTANLPVETLLPIPPPILPPNNPMRASITPAIYISLYEKVIVHNLTPSCPVNLADMIRSCVAGWKRDGEWPPRPSAVDPTSVVAVRKKKKRPSVASGEKQTGSRRMSFGFLGRGEKTTVETEEASSPARGIRRSLQRVLGFGQPSPPPSSTAVATPAPENRPAPA
ncbi:hypothetical protein ACRALDRAFT_2029509 [Sodiomyces alcalophilus JCM 7366]|uniref:uncharacterized protein n=1 Tax=Sodiomyces alcalophilus JCM 7366 TaxID=591952 RepID=UPI0039B61C01